MKEMHRNIGDTLQNVDGDGILLSSLYLIFIFIITCGDNLNN